jgi:hypothetical protein
MNRYSVRVVACLLLVVLASEFLLCNVSPFGVGVSAVDVLALPRAFTFSTPLFAPTSAWNQEITGAETLASSDEQVLVTYRVLLGDDFSLSPGTGTPGWPFPYVNHDEYAIPIFRAGSRQQSVLLCDYEGYTGSTNPKLPATDGYVDTPAPAGTIRPSGPQDTDADGHLVLYDPDTFIAHDFWNATTSRNGLCQSLGGGLVGSAILEAGVVDVFDVREEGANPDTYFSARATGVPLLAGLILPEDVEAGVIAHALAVAIPGPRNTAPDPYEPLASDYFYPASTTEGDFYNTDPDALAAGQRLRLYATIVDDAGSVVDEGQLTPVTRMFLAALRTYGAILVDNAGGFIFYAEDIHTADLDLTDDQVNELIGLPPGTPLPPDKTKWQLVMEKLNEELEQIPFAYGPESSDPAQATITSANFEVVDPDTVSVLTAVPSSRAIDPGGEAVYEIGVGNGFSGTVTLTTTSPSLDLTLELIPIEVSPPGQTTLTITDHHPGPTLMPGLWYTIPITATGSMTQAISVALLVGGARVCLPIILTQ